MKKPVPLGISTPKLLTLVPIALSTLNSWVDRGYCAPTVMPSDGKRAVRYWAPRDVVIVKAIKALRDVGCSLSRISQVQRILDDQWNEDLAEAALLWNGKDVVYYDSLTSESTSLLSAPGQGMFTDAVMVSALPLGSWLRDSLELAEPVDLVAVRASRDAVRARRAM